MKSVKSHLTILVGVGLLFLAACSSSTEANQNNNSTFLTPTTPAQPEASKPTNSTSTAAKTDHSQPSKGGQVVETGSYHLELVTQKEASGTHVDFYLLKGDAHETVPNAKVTAQIQSPDGTQKSLDFKYDPEGKHYAALFPDKTAGKYQVKMTADIGGEKVDGRFSFSQ
jgi:nitrogen fixation protein FixH